MNNFDNYIWKSKDGADLKMIEMDAQHLQAAHTHACAKEFQYHQKTGFFSDLRDQLEEVAMERGIELAFPDETHPSPKWGAYFCNIRKTKAITPTVVRRSALASYVGLKEVNTLGDA